MKNEEAIASIKAHCRYCRMFPKCVNDKPECFLAIEMAIEALQQQNLVNDSQGFSQGDYISRQAAIDAIDGIDWYHQNRNKDMVSGANPDEHQAWFKADDVYKALESIPSAQRTGKWIMHLDDLFPVESTMECSQCHKHQPITIDNNFCPNCGADMRGSQNG